MWSIKGQLEAIIYCQVNKNFFQLDVNYNVLTLQMSRPACHAQIFCGLLK